MEVDDEYSRSRDDINETMELANLNQTDLKNTTQVLLPAFENHAHSYKLLELNENIVKVLEEGTCLSFKGQRSEHAVLCTQDHTYEITEAETSNTLLLIENMKLGKDIEGVCELAQDRIVEETRVTGKFNTYYEIKECKPKLGNLMKLLEPSAFNGLEYEQRFDPATLVDWEKLYKNVQASEDELRRALSDNLIANMDGYYRKISFQYEACALNLMLDFMDENSWDVDEIDKEATCEALKELVPRAAFDVIFNKYAHPGKKKNASGDTLYSYDEESTCRFLAQILLASCPKTDYKSFMESWRIGTPEKLAIKEKYLGGIALVTWNPNKMRKEVVSFPESELPENIHQRLIKIFEVKDKWTVNEITPYISKCTTPTADVNTLLTKYTRPSLVNGVKHYSSKHSQYKLSKN